MRTTCRGDAGTDGDYVDEVVAYTVQKPRHAARRFFVHNNSLYSPQAVTDASGTVVERYTYDAYGLRYVDGAGSSTKSAIGMNRGFTGYQLDEESGLYYARARMYSPTQGRWVSRDPLEELEGVNLYAYVENAPIMKEDPHGLSSVGGCAGEAFLGWDTAVGASITVASLPVIPKRYMGDASRYTSLSSKYLAKALPYEFPRQVWAPTAKNIFSGTKVAGRLAGRWVPVVGWGLLAWDAWKFGSCMMR